ncbi:hypothetical protein, partial [Neisseria meningitidis]
RCLALPYYLYCLRLRRLVLIFVNPLYHINYHKTVIKASADCGLLQGVTENKHNPMILLW